MAHCFDLQPDDTLFWMTDMGWMMGPWAIVGALMLGATLLLYDGAPDYPGPDRLWDLVGDASRDRAGRFADLDPLADAAWRRAGDDSTISRRCA